MRLSSLLGASALIALGAAAAQAGPALDAVKSKGFVQCGVNVSGLPGFASVNDQNEWSGIDIDLCKAVAVALFNDPSKVKYTPLNAKERFTALQSGQIDVLSRNTTNTLSRDTSLGLDFPAINYYDGQGFMATKDLGVKSALELDGASVCVQAGTTTELNLADFFRANNMQYQGVVFENNDEVLAAYDGGRCDVLTTDASGLYSTRTKLQDPDAHMVLPEIISKEPLGPAVRQGDDEWADVVRWSFYAMVQAEEFGITSENVDQIAAETENPDIQRFLGKLDELGSALGVSNDFAHQIVKQIGNYGESFERNVGMDSPLQIERGLNALWTEGGLQYAMPFR
ncbi:amino acid ABC transporter substrate-binding protein [Geminicoccus roseus]|uniref:amino acid ABC transporter substrate-binding protein n=1 Tax=Geminicoccus roseus TaxID=404900 RepID=UPI000409E135|nr:amino acid ABC transporter substrate-binding protein [Geminicoccus roseus]